MLAKSKPKSVIKPAFTLHRYCHDFDAGLTEMWNESDDQWPGTFTEGVPLTEQRLAEWMDRVAAIIKFVIVKDDDGKVVGYGDLWEDHTRPRACYVALLNVHPDYQGLSLARRMLTEMVDWAVENGYDRITIETWPSNLKAMPLYKKVGFFWQPDTIVRMENYVPAVRALPLAHDFFSRNDWYRTYRRDLSQVEDDMRHPHTGDMKVYVLRWEADSDLLEAIFDRNAQFLTGIETRAFAAYARVLESEPVLGLDYSVEWELLNKGERPLPVTLLVSASPGIELDQRCSVTLRAGERRVVAGSFKVVPAAPKLDASDFDRPTPAIKTVLVVDGNMLEFRTGLRYRPAVEINLEPQRLSLLPGQTRTVHLQLRSRVPQPIEGVVTLTSPEGLKTDWLRHDFSVDSKGYAGFPLTLTADRAGDFSLEAGASFADPTSGGESRGETSPRETSPRDASPRMVHVPLRRLPLLVVAPGGLASGRGEDALVLENDFFRLDCQAKGGDTRLWNKFHQREHLQILEELGPPFAPWELNAKTYDLALEHGDGFVKARMTVPSDRFPGLTLTREITMTASPLLKIRYRIVHTGLETHTFQVQPLFHSKRYGRAGVAVPLEAGVVTGNTARFMTADGDVPREASQLPEEWLAYDEQGQVCGVIWSEEAEKLQANWGRLFIIHRQITLAPQEAWLSPPFYVYAGPGDWRVVQQTWRRLKGEPAAVSDSAAGARAYLRMRLSPEIPVSLDGHIEARLQVDNTREYPLAGTLTVEPPPGWDCARTQFVLRDLQQDNPFDEPLSLTASRERVGTARGNLHLKTQLFDETGEFTVIRLGRASEKVASASLEREEFVLWRITNGRCAWEVAPAFHGGVIAWREQGREANHLLTSFPAEGELSWIKPFFGGLRPILRDPEKEEGWPGKLHEETFETSPVNQPDDRGLPWGGVQLHASLTHEPFRGLQVEIAYLTLPGSNVLKVVYRLFNQTDVYRAVEPGLVGFFQVDGEHQNGVLYGDGIQQKRTSQEAWIMTKTWGVVANPATGRAAVMVNARGPEQVQLLDWAHDGGHLYAHQTYRVPPRESFELVLYLALAESVAEAKLYKALEKL